MLNSQIASRSILTIVVSLSPILSFGQHDHTSMPPPQENKINGAIHPELIPDEVAFRMFYRALWLPASATEKQIDRQRSKLQEAHLSDPDLHVFFLTMADFGTRLTELDREVDRVKTSQSEGVVLRPEQISDFNTRRSSLTASATSSLHGQMSTDGMRQLTELVQAEKKNITLFFQPT